MRAPMTPGRWRVLVFAGGAAIGAAGFLSWTRLASREVPPHEAATRAIVDLVSRFHPDGAALPEAAVRKALSEGRVVPGDWHSVVLNEATARETFGEDPARVGIGVEILRSPDGLAVLSVFPESPAARAGLRPGDRITAIGRRPVGGIAAETAAARLRGAAGSSVPVAWWEGLGGAIREKAIARSPAAGPSCRARTLAGGVVIVRIDRLEKGVDGAILDLLGRDGGPSDGVVLDLRDCAGDDLTAAVRIASLFVPEGATLGMLSGPRFGPSGEWLVSSSGAPFTGVPLAVLVNRRTASAAEFLAGSLRALGRARLAGEPTFGKGTVQERFSIPGGTLLLTTGRLAFPDGRMFDGTGLVPDFAAEGAGDDIPESVPGLVRPE